MLHVGISQIYLYITTRSEYTFASNRWFWQERLKIRKVKAS